MLSTPNALAVTFRDVLQGDPLQYELLGILGKKYAPAPSQCAPSAPSPAPPSGVTLPAVTLTDEGGGRESSRLVQQYAESMRKGGWQGDPIEVVEHKGKRYILDGHHRVEAARRAGIDVQYEIVGPSEMAKYRYKSIDDIIRAAAEAGPNRLR
jgi:hypothetical protein